MNVFPVPRFQWQCSKFKVQAQERTRNLIAVPYATREARLAKAAAGMTARLLGFGICGLELPWCLEAEFGASRKLLSFELLTQLKLTGWTGCRQSFASPICLATANSRM